jgi:hypothetical protein
MCIVRATMSGTRWIVLAVAIAAPACALEVTYDDGHYACAPPSGPCPAGTSCSPQGYCEPPAGQDGGGHEIDAAIEDDGNGGGGFDARGPDGSAPPDPDDAAVVDAKPAPPDAPPPPPDAMPLPPDAHPGPQTVVLVAARDTQLHGGNHTFNYGGATDVVCNGNPDAPVLFAWNLSAIPAGAIVQSASVRLTTGDNALQGESSTVFALLEDWTEGNLNGAAGVASYDQRKAGTAWATAGAKPPSRTTSSIATFAPTTPNTSFDFALPKALVQGWVSTPATNFGIIVTCPFSNDVALHSRAVGAAPPRLTVTYQP